MSQGEAGALVPARPEAQRLQHFAKLLTDGGIVVQPPPAADKQSEADKRKLEYGVATYSDPVLTAQEVGARAYLNESLQRPFDEYIAEFNRAERNSPYNWVLRPEGFAYPREKTDEFTLNPYVKIISFARTNKYKTETFTCSFRVRNKRATVQPHPSGDPALEICMSGLSPFALSLPPMVVKRASVGPVVDKCFQQIVFEGVPLCATPDHNMDWPYADRRPYAMHRVFSDVSDMLELLIEDIAAHLVDAGISSPIPAIMFGIKNGRSKTDLFLETLANLRTHSPLVEHPTERTQVGAAWVDKPNTSLPQVVQFTTRTPMTKTNGGKLIPTADRVRALNAIGYDSRQRMCAADANAVFWLMGGQTYNPVVITRPALVLNTASGGAQLQSVVMDQDELITEIDQNSVVSQLCTLHFKPKRAQMSTGGVEGGWLDVYLEMGPTQYWGPASYYGGGYTSRRAEMPMPVNVASATPQMLAAIQAMQAHVGSTSAPSSVSRVVVAARAVGAPLTFTDIPDPTADDLAAVEQAIKAALAAKATAATTTVAAAQPTQVVKADVVASDAKAVAPLVPVVAVADKTGTTDEDGTARKRNRVVGDDDDDEVVPATAAQTQAAAEAAPALKRPAGARDGPAKVNVAAVKGPASKHRRVAPGDDDDAAAGADDDDDVPAHVDDAGAPADADDAADAAADAIGGEGEDDALVAAEPDEEAVVVPPTPVSPPRKRGAPAATTKAAKSKRARE